MTIAIVIVFVVLLLWGFISGKEGFDTEKWMKWLLWVVGGIAVVIAVFYIIGVESTILNISLSKIGAEVFGQI